MKQVTFRVESSFGRTRAYPVSQEAILLCRLTGAKTLLPQDIGTIAGLGYECINEADKATITPSQLW
jgi:hypothetical protein